MPFKNDDMKRIFKMYEEYKDRNSYIEFDDFLNMANEAFDKNEDILASFYKLEGDETIIYPIENDEDFDIVDKEIAKRCK